MKQRFLWWLLVLAFVGMASEVHGQSCPTVVVIIPEEVIIRLVPTRVPDPAAETAIIHAFLDYGFHVVDQDQIRAIRYTQLVSDAVDGQQGAISQLSDRFSADILVLGEAFAEETETPGQLALQSARARIELRAIESATGRIIAAEALHTGGIDLSMATAAKKALQRAGEEIACQLARGIVRYIPTGCVRVACAPEAPMVGVTPFENQSGVRLGDLPSVLTTMMETSLSERGCRTAHAMAGDFVVTGVVTDYKQLLTPALRIPGLDWLWRTGTCWMTVDVQVFDLHTAEMKAHEVTANVSGVEIFGIRFGFSSRNLARKASQLIAARIGALCERR